MSLLFKSLLVAILLLSSKDILINIDVIINACENGCDLRRKD